MLFLQKACKTCEKIFFLFVLICAPSYVCSSDNNTNVEFAESEIQHLDISDRFSKKASRTLSYFLYVEDFIQSFIEIPTSNVLVDSSTISSKYLAGRAALYNLQNEKVGTCSASFLCIQNADGIYTDISNYLSVNNGLVVSWFTPTTLVDLELDSIIHSMVTECIVKASTKIGVNPFYGRTFNMIVSSDSQKIYFTLTQLPDYVRYDCSNQ